MTKQQFTNSTKAMLRTNNIEEKINQMINKALHSGCIDVENTSADDYTSRKALLHVILQNIADDYKPLSREGAKEVKNIKCFI